MVRHVIRRGYLSNDRASPSGRTKKPGN